MENALEERLFSVNDISYMFSVSRCTIHSRARKRGIRPTIISGIKHFNNYQLNLLDALPINRPSKISETDKAAIIKEFRTNNNSVSAIAAKLNLSPHRVDGVINNFLSQKYLVIESKMNYESFDY